MIDGDLKDLPPLPKSMVRVFLSSTFSGKIFEELLYTKKIQLMFLCTLMGQSVEHPILERRVLGLNPRRTISKV